MSCQIPRTKKPTVKVGSFYSVSAESSMKQESYEYNTHLAPRFAECNFVARAISEIN